MDGKVGPWRLEEISLYTYMESVQGVGCRCVDCEVWLAVRNVNAKGRTQGVECRGV